MEGRREKNRREGMSEGKWRGELLHHSWGRPVWFSFWFIFLVLVLAFQLLFSFSFVLVFIIFFVLVSLLVLPIIYFISERELMFMFAICRRASVCRLSSVCRLCRLSVCLSSVCNVRAPYSDDWNFRQCFCAM